MAKIILMSDSAGAVYPRTSNGALTSSDALDNINFEGTFWCNAVGGRPQTTNTYAWLIVHSYGESCYQEYIPYTLNGAPEIYVRYFVSGNGWSPWRKVSTSAV